MQSISAGCISITCPTNSLSFSNSGGALTNHADNYGYDASGNMTNDGDNNLVYDGENRVTSSRGSLNSGTYSYDGNGLRVEKTSSSTTTVYIFSGSKVIAEYEGSSPSNLNLTREYVYAGGPLLASISGTTTTYYHQHHLSNRLVTSSTGTVVENLGAYPYGESWYNATNDKWAFTSYERDAESGNAYAMARYYVNRLGRFSSPDALSGSALDPQSLNHYSYTGNDPVNAADPSGMVTVPLVYLSGGFGGGGFGDDWNEFDLLENPIPVYGYEFQYGTSVTSALPTADGFAPVGTTNTDVWGWGVVGYYSMNNSDDFGPSGGPGDQKEKLLIKTALQEKNLSKCLHEFFGPGTILTNANLPRIDASHDLSGAGKTNPADVPATGRGTVQIDKGTYNGLSGDDPYLVGTYLHETANVLAIQQFTSIYPRWMRGYMGPLGGPPTAAQKGAFDKDIGEQFEHCIRN